MKKFKKIFVILILALIMVTPTFAGCSLGSFSCAFLQPTDSVETPTLSLYSDSKCLGWNTVNKSNKYAIYLNGSVVDSVAKTASSDKSLVYDFSHLLTSAGNYKFYIVAISSTTLYFDSDPSNTVTYVCKSAGQTPKFTTMQSIASDNLVDITNNGAKIKFTQLDDPTIDSYLLYLYSNSTGLNSYPANPNTEINLLLKEYDLANEIYAIRIGAVRGEDVTIVSDVFYYNPATHQSNFTDKIYCFDGQINDYYINSIPELNNFVYYLYIHRMSEVQIMLSKTFEELVSYKAGNDNYNKAEKLQLAVLDSYDQFIETEDAYSLQITLTVPAARIYKIEIALQSNTAIGLDECTVNSSIVPPQQFSSKEIASLLNSGYDIDMIYTYLKQSDTETYYDNCDHILRVDDPQYQGNPYDNFVSDRQFLSQSVKSSEELYWAVENKVTPIPEPNSIAEEIYALAKSTLRSIISDTMTDYEKALCIFEWICSNTVYDNYSTFPGTYGDYINTNIPSYYLEGVFKTGFSVCDGFSKAFSLMCNMEGIDAIRIVGKQGQYGHAWNKVFIDKEPTDEIDGQYYYVDITWSEIKRAGDYEDMTHQYFLVSDQVVNGYPYYPNRTKFSNYKANAIYEYYHETTYTYQGGTYDLVIDNYEDIRPLFYYALDNNLSALEIVVDYEFYQDIYNSRENIDDSPIDALALKFKHYKFNEQAFELGFGDDIVYNNDGDVGMVMTLFQAFRIDENPDNETYHLLEYLDINNLYGVYKLEVTTAILNKCEGDILSKVTQVFAKAISKHDLQIEFEVTSVVIPTNGDIEFLMTVSATE